MFDSRFVLKNRQHPACTKFNGASCPTRPGARANICLGLAAKFERRMEAADRTNSLLGNDKTPLSRCNVTRQQLPLHSLRRSSLAPRAPRTSKLKVVLPMARRLFARCAVFVQALDQIRPALGRRLLHKGVKIALKRAPETPRRIHGPSAHDGARSWDVLWRKNAKCSERFRAPPETGVPARRGQVTGILRRRIFFAPRA